MNHAIEVTSLEKRYGAHKVLKGLTFSVRQGEIFALLGANGAGKTTTLECLEGLRPYDSGCIVVSGKRGIQLQSASLPGYLQCREAVQLFAKWNHVPVDTTMLAALGIPDLAKKRYNTLSTGQKRRLHLALALLGRPDTIFLDEPTAGLDIEGRAALHRQIRQLKQQGKTILLASHDMTEVESLCDRLAILVQGTLALLGTPTELRNQVGRRYTLSLQTTQGTETYATENIGDTLLTVLTQYRAEGKQVLDLQVSQGSLEEYFLQIVKGEGSQ